MSCMVDLGIFKWICVHDHNDPERDDRLEGGRQADRRAVFGGGGMDVMYTKPACANLLCLSFQILLSKRELEMER